MTGTPDLPSDFCGSVPAAELPGVDSFNVILTRRAICPRGVARASEIWRMAQEVAVQASGQRGWPPERFSREGVGFLVIDTTVEHLRELSYGEKTCARTWTLGFRRGTFCDREVRLSGDAGPLARVTQRWVHVRRNDDHSLVIDRASPDLVSAYGSADPGFPAASLPRVAVAAPTPTSTTFTFDIWHTWMDPFGHVNHPMYVDFCEEALARETHRWGLDAQAIVPVAERMRYRLPAMAGDQVSVVTRVLGVSAHDDVVFEVSVRRNQDDAVLASGTLVRRHLTDPAAWRAAWSGIR